MSKPPGISFSRSDRGVGPPPDYSSRRVQLRLMTLVFSLMLVLTLMFEARKAENWRWLWGKHGDAEREIDTRLAPGSLPDASLPAGTFRAPPERSESPSSKLAPGEDPPPNEDAAEALRRAEQDGWRRALDPLTRDERTSLSQALRHARIEQALEEESQGALAALVVRLEDAWQEHFTLALNSLVKDRRLSEEQRRKWTQVVTTLRQRWQGSREALAAMSQGLPVDEPQRRRLGELEEVVHQLSLEQIKDDTVWRKDEADAWYRLLERLQGADLDDLERRAKSVGFVPLYRQPDVHRGKLVTIAGTARAARRREAGPNVFGIDDYYMVTVQPLSGNSPLIVYALELPPGFPTSPEDHQGQYPPLDEPVTFTGYFFKRWAYSAQDGIRTAPLLAAKAPRWKPAARLRESRRLPSQGELALILGATALLGAAVAALVYWQTRRESPQLAAWRRWLESEEKR